jgi:hypothetical protein
MRKRHFLTTSFCAICLSALALVTGSGLTLSAQVSSVADANTVFRLRIRSDRPSYEVGVNIPIHVEVINVSSQEVFVGRNLWMNFSPSRVTLFVTRIDGPNNVPGEGGAADGVGPSGDLTQAMMNWVVLLPPGYSYGATTGLQKNLKPGTYKVRALFRSSGIDTNSFYNPLVQHPDELEKFRAQNWKGEVYSNDLTIRIVAQGAGQAPK